MKINSGKRISLHRLIDKLTTNAMTELFLHMGNRACDRPFRPQSASDMPGYRIKQLSPDEREALSHATSEDFSWRGFK